MRDSALPTFIVRRHALGAQEWGGLSPILTHTRAAVLRSQVGRVLLLSRTAKLTVPPQKNLLCGCEKRGLKSEFIVQTKEIVQGLTPAQGQVRILLQLPCRSYS